MKAGRCCGGDPDGNLSVAPLPCNFFTVNSSFPAKPLGVLQLAAALPPPTQVSTAAIGKAAASRSTPRGFAEKNRAFIWSV